jgi:hypothetical protein
MLIHVCRESTAFRRQTALCVRSRGIGGQLSCICCRMDVFRLFLLVCVYSIETRTLITAFDMPGLAVGAGLAAAGNAHHLESRMDVNR